MFVVVIFQKAVPYRTMRYNWWITAPDLFSDFHFLLFLLLINISLIILTVDRNLFSNFVSLKYIHYYFASDDNNNASIANWKLDRLGPCSPRHEQSWPDTFWKAKVTPFARRVIVIFKFAFLCDTNMLSCNCHNLLIVYKWQVWRHYN